MRRRVELALVALVLVAGPVRAQNAITGPALPRAVDDGPPVVCGQPNPTVPAGGVDIDLWTARPPSVQIAYCAALGWPSGLVAQTWGNALIIDGGAPLPVTGVRCPTAEPPYECHAALPLAALEQFRRPGRHEYQLELTATDGGMVRSAVAQITTPDGCPYAAPGATATTMRPRFRDDPVNGSIQGFNPIAGQAARVAQLRAWGWRVEWQFVRADVDRLFLMVWCDPLSTQVGAP